MSVKAKTKKAGRPSVFKPEYVEQAGKLAHFGATVREIGEFFDVNEVTITRWMQQNEAFCTAIKVGREASDDRVEQSLYRRAVGYTHNATKIMQHMGEPVIVPYVEHVPPDVAACIFWLKNRRRTQWREKVEVEHSAVGDLADVLRAARQRVTLGREPLPAIEHQP
jgi:hypothetical protein